jgi:hypothetical protein
VSQIGRGFGIQFLAEQLIVLCLINSGVGGTVHNAVNSVFLNKAFDSFLINDVQLGYVCIEKRVLSVLPLKQLNLVSKLTVATRNQYVHLFKF